MFSVRRNLLSLLSRTINNTTTNNIITIMGKTIKPKPTGVEKSTRGRGGPNNNRNFTTRAPRQYPAESAAMAPRVSTPPLTEAIPADTMRFADLGAENLLDPILLKTITEDLKFNHMMPVSLSTPFNLHDICMTTDYSPF